MSQADDLTPGRISRSSALTMICRTMKGWTWAVRAMSLFDGMLTVGKVEQAKSALCERKGGVRMMPSMFYGLAKELIGRAASSLSMCCRTSRR